MPVNVSEALDGDTSQIIKVKRTAPGSYIGGLFQSGVASNFKTFASCQPASPKELLMLAEGERDKNIFKFISKKELRTGDDTNQTQADIVTFKGRTFKIIKVGDWQSFGHSTAFGAEEQVQA